MAGNYQSNVTSMSEISPFHPTFHESLGMHRTFTYRDVWVWKQGLSSSVASMDKTVSCTPWNHLGRDNSRQNTLRWNFLRMNTIKCGKESSRRIRKWHKTGLTIASVDLRHTQFGVKTSLKTKIHCSLSNLVINMWFKHHNSSKSLPLLLFSLCIDVCLSVCLSVSVCISMSTCLFYVHLCSSASHPCPVSSFLSGLNS